MQQPPPPYEKVANRVDLGLDLEAGHIINQQPTAHAAMAYSIKPRRFRFTLASPHIECDCCQCEHSCTLCGDKGCTTHWGTTLVLVLVMVTILLALWLLRKA